MSEQVLGIIIAIAIIIVGFGIWYLIIELNYREEKRRFLAELDKAMDRLDREHEFNQTLLNAIAEAWQDGHDTALINGKSENPYRKETK